MASQGGQVGVAIVGPTAATSAFYPADPTKWLQVVVLSRQNLSLVSNTNYDCPEATSNPYPVAVAKLTPCIEKVKADLAKLPATDLVIATNPPPIGGSYDTQPPNGMFRALGAGIGVQAWNWWNESANIVRGTFSAIGYGKGHLMVEHPSLYSTDVPEPQQRSGAITGNLVRDNDGNYTFDPGERLTFNTQAPGSNADQNVIEVGDHRFVQPIPNHATPHRGGFEVLVVDSRTLDGESKYFRFDTYPQRIAEQLQAMRDMLAKANQASAVPFSAPKLVFVVSRGNPSFQNDNGEVAASDEVDRTLTIVTDQIEGMGGTRSRFFVATDPAFSGGGSFTLVSIAGSQRGTGAELSGPAPADKLNGPNTVPLEGTLARTGTYDQYQVQTDDRVATGESISKGITELLQTAGQAPTPWPETGNPGRTAAVQYLGNAVLGTPDPRGQYWTATYDSTKWRDIAAQISGLSYPCCGFTFSAENLSWAQQELVKEIGWLISEHTYLNALAQPFAKEQLTSWAALQQIAANINAKVQPDPNRKAKLVASAVFNYAVDIGEETPLIGHAIGVANAIYTVATEIASINGERVEEPFEVPVADAGDALAKRLEAAQTFLTSQLPNVIASDYDRLKTVGACGSELVSIQADCPFDLRDWQYTQDDQRAAAKGVEESAKIAAYGALLPVKYTAWLLPQSPHTDANNRFAGRPIPVIGECFYPFATEPASAQFAKPIYRRIPFYNDDRWEITALGYLTGSGKLSDRWDMHVPDGSVTDELFHLGVNKEEFFDRFFFPGARLEHFPEDTTPTGWDLGCTRGQAPSGLGQPPSGLG